MLGSVLFFLYRMAAYYGLYRDEMLLIIDYCACYATRFSGHDLLLALGGSF